jgi:hypothetical protein
MGPVDVSGDGIFRLASRLPCNGPDELCLDALEEGCHHRVAIAVALAAHRDRQALFSKKVQFFFFGGLVKDEGEDESQASELHEAFKTKWNVTAPLHSSESLFQNEVFSGCEIWTTKSARPSTKTCIDESRTHLAQALQVLSTGPEIKRDATAKHSEKPLGCYARTPVIPVDLPAIIVTQSPMHPAICLRIKAPSRNPDIMQA